MDVSDAVSGIMAIEAICLKKRDAVYNLGPGVQYSILEYAESSNEIGKKFGFNSINIIVEDNGKEFAICMDISKMISDSIWLPKVNKKLMIENLFKTKTK